MSSVCCVLNLGSLRCTAQRLHLAGKRAASWMTGHTTVNTELDSVSWVLWRDDVFPTRVISILLRDERGVVHSCAELERHAFKLHGVSSAASFKFL